MICLNELNMEPNELQPENLFCIITSIPIYKSHTCFKNEEKKTPQI